MILCILDYNNYSVQLVSDITLRKIAYISNSFVLLIPPVLSLAVIVLLILAVSGSSCFQLCCVAH